MLPGGHFFADQFPDEAAARLLRFLDGVAPCATAVNRVRRQAFREDRRPHSAG